MRSRDITIFSIALGTWMAWRLLGSSLLPVGSQEIGIAVIVLFKPWLDNSGWFTLLTINAMSYIHRWYWSWLTLSSMFNERWPDLLAEMGLISEGRMSNFSMSGAMTISVITIFIYTYFIWPNLWEKVYRKAGVWGKLKWVK